MTDTDKIRLTASGDAFKRDLVDYDVRGGFTEEVAYQLQLDSDLASEIIQKILGGHFPDTWHEDILQGVGIELTSKGTIRQKRDPNFRPNILKAYEYRCAVCGFDMRLGRNPVALEAAHIKWRQAGGPDLEVNGLALCSLHHKLFDRGAFTLSNDLEILVSDDAHGTAASTNGLCASTARNSISRSGRPITPAKTTHSGTSERCFKGSTVKSSRQRLKCGVSFWRRNST